MRKEDLHAFGLIEFRPDEGSIYFKDRRMVLLSATSFYIWREHLLNALGEKTTRQLVIRSGYCEGFLSYLCASQLFGSHEGFVVAPRLEEVMGLLKSEVNMVCEDPTAFQVIVHHHNSVEAEQHILFNGLSTTPVCWWTVGFASGYCSAERRLEIYCKEIKCSGCGDKYCITIGRDAASWGDEINSLRADFGFRNFQDIEKLWAEQRAQFSILANKHKHTRRMSALDNILNENTTVRKQILESLDENQYIVRESKMIDIVDQAVCVARLDTPVLVQGETGTGKEFLIRLIHRLSVRGGQELVSVNCAALTESLLESELFGHVRGAFTGAITDKAGLFELASEGTLFLDELGEMPLALQAKLLRAIENGEIRRVGSNKTIRVKPRILAATNRDLQGFVASGAFRQDLYFRLNSFVIQLPPLRERKESIPALIQTFLKEICANFGKNIIGVAPDAMTQLLAYPWPGNIRELKHAIERAVVVTRGDTIQLSDLSFEIRSNTLPEKESKIDLKRGERQVIADVLSKNNGNRTATANDLDISISTLWRKMKRYGLS